MTDKPNLKKQIKNQKTRRGVGQSIRTQNFMLFIRIYPPNALPLQVHFYPPKSLKTTTQSPLPPSTPTATSGPR